jgi:hypothetical protein
MLYYLYRQLTTTAKEHKMLYTTHNGNIKSDESQSGYIWFSCKEYDLPDNTTSGQGYHVVYRPLCKPHYEGTELVTERMMQDVREHYGLVESLKENERIEAEKKFWAEIEILKSAQTTNKTHNPLCPHCGTYCYGDCQAN